MVIIDKNGRLFGKLNIIDLIVIIVVGLGLYWVGGKVYTRYFSPEQFQDRYRIVLRAENVHPEMADSIKAGYKLVERSGNIVGNVDSDPILKDAIVYVRTPQGTIEGSTAKLVINDSVQPKLKDMDIEVIATTPLGKRLKYNTQNVLVGSRIEYDFVQEGSTLGAHLNCLCVDMDQLEN
jgi:hypothetical protein